MCRKENLAERQLLQKNLLWRRRLLKCQLHMKKFAGEATSTATEGPVQSREELKVSLEKEEIDDTKQPYVKEEVSVKKKLVTETRQVNEEVRSERVNVSGSSSGAE